MKHPPARCSFVRSSSPIRIPLTSTEDYHRFLTEPSVRAGTAIQAATIPKRPRKGTTGSNSETDQYPGEDLVPEPTVQEQTREVRGRGETSSSEREEPVSEEDPRAGIDQRW